MYNEADISQIRNYMVGHHHTLAVAESVTAGHLQAALSLAAEATLFFQGGITTYNLGQKARHLNINPIHAMSCNSVSEQVAREMASHTCSLFSSDWSLAITGYAAPMPELGVNDLYAFFAIAFRGKVLSVAKIESSQGAVYDVQVHYATEVLKAFNTLLSANGKEWRVSV